MKRFTAIMYDLMHTSQWFSCVDPHIRTLLFSLQQFVNMFITHCSKFFTYLCIRILASIHKCVLLLNYYASLKAMHE